MSKSGQMVKKSGQKSPKLSWPSARGQIKVGKSPFFKTKVGREVAPKND
jgi:hypothetical protein